MVCCCGGTKRSFHWGNLVVFTIPLILVRLSISENVVLFYHIVAGTLKDHWRNMISPHGVHNSTHSCVFEQQWGCDGSQSHCCCHFDRLILLKKWDSLHNSSHLCALSNSEDVVVVNHIVVGTLKDYLRNWQSSQFHSFISLFNH